jgi:hypothetical protein
VYCYHFTFINMFILIGKTPLILNSYIEFLEKSSLQLEKRFFLLLFFFRLKINDQQNHRRERNNITSICSWLDLRHDPTANPIFFSF